ncbi:FAD dependent oxidoreductase [Flagelloscypha sp. PMI_526]|nr:FAD dependent oxidoreductase [Flagelloscypha sp. PMI_526]
MTSRHIVIVGGGIIGTENCCTTAYYLSSSVTPKSGISVTLIEASKHGVAQGAVAKWAYPTEIVGISFQEHVRLAEKYNGAERWGFRFVSCGQWEGTGKVSSAKSIELEERKSLKKTLGLRATGAKAYSLRDTAQVHPYLFTTSMLDLAKANGVKYIQGTVKRVEQDGRKVSGVVYDDIASVEQILEATDVVVCAGAWSPRILKNLPIDGLRAHSVTIQAQEGVTISPYVLFTEISGHDGPAHPEIYARPGNEVYACGPGDSPPLPDNVDDVEIDESRCESIIQHVSSISNELRDGRVDKRQACFLPVASRGEGPFIGKPSTIQNLYVAAGHTCWGISNGPGTGLAISQLVLDGKISCANLSRLSPSRFI